MKILLKKNIENYSNQTSQSLHQLQNQIFNISNQNELNITWNKILKALTKAALKNIPYKNIKTFQKIKDNKPSKRHTLFYRYKQIQYLKNYLQSSIFIIFLMNTKPNVLKTLLMNCKPLTTYTLHLIKNLFKLN